MVIVRVRIEDDDIAVGQLVDHIANVADAETGIEHQGKVIARYQEGDDFFELAGLVDGENPVVDPVNLEPALALLDPLEYASLRAR